MFGVGLPVPLLGLVVAAHLFEQGAEVIHGSDVARAGRLPEPLLGFLPATRGIEQHAEIAHGVGVAGAGGLPEPLRSLLRRPAASSSTPRWHLNWEKRTGAAW